MENADWSNLAVHKLCVCAVLTCAFERGGLGQYGDNCDVHAGQFRGMFLGDPLSMGDGFWVGILDIPPLPTRRGLRE